MSHKLAESIRNMVLGHPSMSVEQIAEAAFGCDEQGKPRKSPWSLYRMLNPEDPGAKVGAIELVGLMLACGSSAPLHVMAAEMGLIVSATTTHEPDGRDMTQECLQGFLAVSAYAEAAEAGAHYVELEPLLAAAIQELEDVFKRARARDYRPQIVKKAG
jgi:hypothetical protein